MIRRTMRVWSLRWKGNVLKCLIIQFKQSLQVSLRFASLYPCGYRFDFSSFKVLSFNLSLSKWHCLQNKRGNQRKKTSVNALRPTSSCISFVGHNNMSFDCHEMSLQWFLLSIAQLFSWNIPLNLCLIRLDQLLKAFADGIAVEKALS